MAGRGGAITQALVALPLDVLYYMFMLSLPFV